MSLVVNIDMDKRCAECGKGGATDSGICLRCAAKAIEGLPMRSSQGQAVQRRITAILKPKGFIYLTPTGIKGIVTSAALSNP